MADADMIEEVKSLVREGYSLDKIRGNLVKIGYSEADADAMIQQATGPAPVAPTPAALPAPEPVAATPVAEKGLEGLQTAPTEETSEEDLLLAAESTESIIPPAPAKLPEVEGPVEKPVEPPKHHHRRHHGPKPPEPKAEVPDKMGEETKPKSGAGKAIMIFLFAFIVIVILAYFILFPKLGIDLTTLI